MGGAPALERGLQVLEMIAECGALGYGQLVERLGLPPASAGRLLQVLVSRGYLAKSERGVYQLGSKLDELTSGTPVCERLRHAAGPALKELSAAASNTALVVYWTGESWECVAKALHEDSIVMQQASDLRTDIFDYPWGGFAHRALTSAGQLNRFELSAETARGLRRDLEQFDREGFIICQSSAINRICAPICLGDRLIGAVGLGGTTSSLPQDALAAIGALVAAKAQTISQII